MIYRKLPAAPPRLLLRVVATAGTGALLGIAACGGGTSVMGLSGAPETDSDASEVDSSGDDATRLYGLVAYPDGSPGFCLGLCGLAIPPPEPNHRDASVDASVVDGSSPPDSSPSDAGEDAPYACLGVCGVIVHPEE